ncbi:MAG: hypothetical protein Q7T49_01535 [bacterium]|nr:hypothetical protein [bacterium]
MTIKKGGGKWEFDNGKLHKVFPSNLIPEELGDKDTEDYRAFLLTLSVIFNDLKGLIILHDTLPDIYRKPPDEETSSHSGEYNGLEIQLLRMLFATLHEFLEFIKEKHKIYEGKYFQQLLSSCSRNTQQIWTILSDTSRRVSPVNSEMNKLKELADKLQQIRDNISFHYQTRKKLMEGFRRFFYGIMKITPEAKKWVFWSGTKTSFGDIHFYYADAALQGYLEEKDTSKAFELMSLIAKAISDVLLEYHEKLPNR